MSLICGVCDKELYYNLNKEIYWCDCWNNKKRKVEYCIYCGYMKDDDHECHVQDLADIIDDKREIIRLSETKIKLLEEENSKLRMAIRKLDELLNASKNEPPKDSHSDSVV